MSLNVQSLPDIQPSSAPYSTISLTQMLRPQTVGGKVGIAVDDFSVFSHYKHIKPIPAGNSGTAFSSSRLRFLDNLIDRLVKLKEDAVERVSPEDIQGMSNQALDSMIEELARQYRSLSSRSIEALSRENSSDFGINSSDSALALNIMA